MSKINPILNLIFENLMIIDDSVFIKNGQGRSFIEKNIISIEYSVYILGYFI